MNIIQLGIGNVGKELINQVKTISSLKYVGICNSRKGKFNVDGINNFIEINEDFDALKLIDLAIKNNVKDCIIVDVTASEKTLFALKQALKYGYFVVLANKKPLADSFEIFKEIYAYKNKLFFECTVGAALPIVYSIKSMINTGDKITQINGCFSGTLGYVFSELEKGNKFSDIISRAKELGYTEPDPRDDLSGLDVARKALILARLIGYELELEDIRIEDLVPGDLKNCSVDEFLLGFSDYNFKMDKRMQNAKNEGFTLRYVATIKENNINIGIKEVKLDSSLGSLNGPDNICVINSNRYNENPLVIQGPGAGVKVTADGVLRNILECDKKC